MWYNAGTASVVNNSVDVTGALTLWVDNVDAGQAFIGPDGIPYEIASIVSATALKLRTPYRGSSAAGQAYTIMPAQGYLMALAKAAAALVQSFADVRDGIGQGVFPAGSVATPGFRFAGDENTGITQTGPDTFAIVVNGQVVANFNVNGFSPERILIGDGTAAAPAMGFIADPNTGFRRPGADQLAVVTNGADNVLFDADGTTRFYGGARFADGTLALPGIRFHLDPDTGLWRPAANAVGLVAGGVEHLRAVGGNVGIGNPNPAYKLDVDGLVMLGKGRAFAQRGNAGTWVAGSAGSQISHGGADVYYDNYEGAHIFRGAAFANRFRVASDGCTSLGDFYVSPGKRVVVTTSAAAGGINLMPGSSADRTGYIELLNRDGVRQGFLGHAQYGAGSIEYNNETGGAHQFTGTVIPGASNTYDIGSAARLWANIRAANGAIQTSDENAKAIEENGGIIPAEWLDAWGNVEWCRFKMKDAVKEKGDGARWHVGLIAQRIRDAFAALDLDASAIGLLCYDEWDEEREPIFEERQIDTETVVIERIATGVLDAKGNIIYREVTQDRPVMGMVDTGETRITLPAGNRWGLRYDECQAMEAAWQRRELARGLQAAEDRIAAAEAAAQAEADARAASNADLLAQIEELSSRVTALAA